jgi:hypothetical protein
VGCNPGGGGGGSGAGGKTQPTKSTSEGILPSHKTPIKSPKKVVPLKK